MSKQQHTASQKGFTIVELMIATAILSTILVIVTIVMVSIGNLYYKGVNQARVQDDVRNIADEVSQHLQLSDGFTTDGGVDPTIPRAYCIGTTRYTYIDNVQIGNSATYKHVLWRDTIAASGGSCTPADLTADQPSAGGTELIAPASRLTDFTISGSSPYNVSIGVAYGGSDLLTGSGLGTVCAGHTGDQFCATADLSINVVQRLTNS